MMQRFLFISIVAGLFFSVSVQASTVNFSGKVRLGACNIHPDDEDKIQPLEEMVDKDFYNGSHRTQGARFSLRLNDCDISVVNGVKIKFSGMENSELPGMLALDPSSTASGVGVGLETVSGSFLPLETQSDEYEIFNGSNLIEFRAFVQGEPDAIANKDIGLGPFSATTTFELEYM